MSRLLGPAGDRWSLARAIDALAESARAAGPPSTLWIAGLFYPGLFLNLGLGWRWLVVGTDMRGPIDESAAALEHWVPGGSRLFAGILAMFCAAPFLFPLLLPLFRCVGGLAALAVPPVWSEAAAGRKSPRLSDAWRRGQGLALSTGGLYLQMLLLVFAAAAVFLGPLVLVASVWHAASGVAADTPPPLWLVFLSGPSTIVVACYALVVSVLLQLSLHSLALNRRGVASALVHAWRLVRQEPWAAARAVLVDGVLSAVVATIAMLLGAFGAWVAAIGGLLLAGFLGVTRACFWSRAYRALGGLGPEDNVPGLQRPAA